MGRNWNALISMGLALVAASTAVAQGANYRVGEEVELMISAGHWQRCTVLDPGSAESVMRMRCQPYSSPSKSRAGGIYVESHDSSGVRRPGAGGRLPSATMRAA